jgi:hypothetical protein
MGRCAWPQFVLRIREGSVQRVEAESARAANVNLDLVLGLARPSGRSSRRNMSPLLDPPRKNMAGRRRVI